MPTECRAVEVPGCVRASDLTKIFEANFNFLKIALKKFGFEVSIGELGYNRDILAAYSQAFSQFSFIKKAILQLEGMITAENKVDQKRLMVTSDTRQPVKCEDILNLKEVCRKQKSRSLDCLSEKEARSLINYMIIHFMVDTRTILPTTVIRGKASVNLIKDLMEEKSLVRLVRRNWVNIWSIKSIIKNISDTDGKLKTFQFGKSKTSDEIYLKSLRRSYSDEILDKLGINKISNQALMEELKILNKGIVDGSPRVEIIQSCQPKEIQVPKECPPAKIKEIVKEIYVETCEGSETGKSEIKERPLQCGVDECLNIAKDYCDKKISSMNLYEHFIFCLKFKRLFNGKRRKIHNQSSSKHCKQF